TKSVGAGSRFLGWPARRPMADRRRTARLGREGEPITGCGEERQTMKPSKDSKFDGADCQQQRCPRVQWSLCRDLSRIGWRNVLKFDFCLRQPISDAVT